MEPGKEALSSSQPRPGFGEAVHFWARLGFISFGGPAGQIALMHEELVERRRWVAEERFQNALSFCMLLPGPEAQQLAIYLGWMLHGVKGGVLAGVLFVLPAALLLYVLSWLYVGFGRLPAVAGVFEGLQPAVLALVLMAVLRMGRKVVRTPFAIGLAMASWGALSGLQVPFPLVIAVALILGLIRGGIATGWAGVSGPSDLPRPDASRTLDPVRVIVIGCLLWAVPMGLLLVLLGRHHAVVEVGFFFSKAAMVTFGGAYAILPYVGRQAVDHFHWLDVGQMMDGLALAESTPGPLVIVLQFFGFLAGWNHPGALRPGMAATLSTLVAIWTTFLPSFVWIFLGAPYVERAGLNPRWRGALDAVMAAVLGVILNLAFWMGIHCLFGNKGRIDAVSLAIAITSFHALQVRRWPLGWVLLGSAAVGGGWRVFVGS